MESKQKVAIYDILDEVKFACGQIERYSKETEVITRVIRACKGIDDDVTDMIDQNMVTILSNLGSIRSEMSNIYHFLGDNEDNLKNLCAPHNYLVNDCDPINDIHFSNEELISLEKIIAFAWAWDTENYRFDAYKELDKQLIDKIYDEMIKRNLKRKYYGADEYYKFHKKEDENA